MRSASKRILDKYCNYTNSNFLESALNVSVISEKLAEEDEEYCYRQSYHHPVYKVIYLYWSAANVIYHRPSGMFCIAHRDERSTKVGH